MNKLTVLVIGLIAFCANAVIIPQIPEKDADGCYRIKSAEDLYGFADEVNTGKTDSLTCAYLDDDITINENLLDSAELAKALANREMRVPEVPAPECIKKGEACKFNKWTPMGSKSGYKFKGHFDGRGHTVRGVLVYAEEQSGTGFFGVADYRSAIKNLNLVDSYIHGKDSVGGIVGADRGGVLNCSFSGVVVGKIDVGGISGAGSTIVFGRNKGFIKGSRGVGGVIGMEDRSGGVGMLSNEGSVYGDEMVGGVLGHGSYLVHSYNAGFVYGYDDVAGLVGYFTKDTLLSNYSIGTVYSTRLTNKRGRHDVGGESLGSIDSSEFRFQYALKDSSYCHSCSARLDSAAFVDGTLVKLLNRFPFVSIWKQGEKYPVLNEDVIPELKDGFYQIKTESQFDWYSEYRFYFPSKGVKLLSDLTFNENVLKLDCVQKEQKCDIHVWKGISSEFYGTFDGNGHSISGLYGGCDEGMFNRIDSSAVVKDFALEDSYFVDYHSLRDNCANCVDHRTFGVLFKRCEGDCQFIETTGEEYFNWTEEHFYGYYSVQYEANEGLWFNGRKLSFYKRKYCYHRDSTRCYPDDYVNTPGNYVYPNRVDTNDAKQKSFNMILLPYRLTSLPLPRFYKKKDAAMVTMDSLGYLAYKYMSWPSDTSAYKDVKLYAYYFVPESSEKRPDELCMTYSSDHDMLLTMYHCRTILPKSSTPTTANIKISSFKPYRNDKADTVSCDSLLRVKSPDFYLGHQDSAKKIEGIARVFEFGPKGTCKGNAKIAEKEPDFCYNERGERDFCKEPLKESELGIAPTTVRVSYDVVHVGKALYFSGFSGAATYRIVDFKGRVVKSGDVAPVVGISGLRAGTYAVLVRDGSKKITKKFLLN